MSWSSRTVAVVCFAALATLAALLAWLGPAAAGWGVAVLLAAPVYLLCADYRKRLAAERQRARQIGELHLATMEALALAIDAKDLTAPSHIRRVQSYAVGLAHAFKMTEAEVDAVRTAALLRDVGKLAVPEHILSKPGRLTQEEFQKIRIHPQVSAEIISAVPFPYPVTPIILNHHERWDGKGYPQGVAGDEIPLGARILAVVDYFDALTSDRPYHKAMTPEAALALITRESGKALDPAIVDTFTRLLPQLIADADRHEAARQALAPAGPPEPARTAVVFEDIARAHREIYALYEIAQTMGTCLDVADTTAQVAARLGHLVPAAACALFLFNDEEDMLRCRFATGVDADLLTTIAVKNGQGPTGWVGRNRRSLVNGLPHADLEVAGLAATTSLKSALIAPLVFHDRLIGTLAVYQTEADSYTSDHRRLLDRVAEQAAAVVHNAIVFERTREASLTDPLTGLPNTRFMLGHLTRELARAERLKSEVALLVMDLDKFKAINDTHGHMIGDRALRAVANVLRSAIRPYDICVRYAGDEFIVVLAGCGWDVADRKLAELQRDVEQADFEARPGRRVPLAVSGGIAIFPHDGLTYEALLATADSRMYRDKARRRQQLAPAASGDGRATARPAAVETLHEPSDIEIQRAGIGVL